MKVVALFLSFSTLIFTPQPKLLLSRYTGSQHIIYEN